MSARLGFICNLEAKMEIGERSNDNCPNCGQPFEILLVKFGLGSVHMITACPNCAMVCADERKGKGRSDKWRKRRRFQIPLRRL